MQTGFLFGSLDGDVHGSENTADFSILLELGDLFCVAVLFNSPLFENCLSLEFLEGHLVHIAAPRRGASEKNVSISAFEVSRRSDTLDKRVDNQRRSDVRDADVHPKKPTKYVVAERRFYSLELPDVKEPKPISFRGHNDPCYVHRVEHLEAELVGTFVSEYQARFVFFFAAEKLDAHLETHRLGEARAGAEVSHHRFVEGVLGCSQRASSPRAPHSPQAHEDAENYPESVRIS